MRARTFALSVSVVVVAAAGMECGRESSDDASSARPLPDRSLPPFPVPASSSASTGTPTPPPPPPPLAIHFVALGDTGTGDSGQRRVASAIAEKCSHSPCDFGVLLGDNFYPVGVTGTGDSQWVTKFEEPYAELPFPFYVVLGNHDYGSDGDEFWRGLHQVAYGAINPKWILPSEWYSFVEGPATFLAVNSPFLIFDRDTEAQRDYFRSVLGESDRPWRIGLLHHPYVSNGHHGNAGTYDGYESPIRSGSYYKAFVDEVLCGEVDLFLTGHDHNLQVLPGPAHCPGTFVVSGGGSFSSGFLGTNLTFFQARTTGFAYVSVEEAQLTIEIVDAESGETAFTRSIAR